MESYKNYDPVALGSAAIGAASGLGAIYAQDPELAAFSLFSFGLSAYTDLTIGEENNDYRALSRDLAAHLREDPEKPDLEDIGPELEE